MISGHIQIIDSKGNLIKVYSFEYVVSPFIIASRYTSCRKRRLKEVLVVIIPFNHYRCFQLRSCLVSFPLSKWFFTSSPVPFISLYTYASVQSYGKFFIVSLDIVKTFDRVCGMQHFLRNFHLMDPFLSSGSGNPTSFLSEAFKSC